MEAEIESREDQENVRRMKRATLVLQSMLAAVPLPPAAAPAVPWPIAPDVADELERSDWTPTDARVLREANHAQAAENNTLRDALQFYADRSHFLIADDDAWDTVSGEPQNFWCDEAGTATVEDGTVAAMALAGTPLIDDEESETAQAAPAANPECEPIDGPIAMPPVTPEQFAADIAEMEAAPAAVAHRAANERGCNA